MKQTIEIEGFPEGWKAVAYRCPESGEYYLQSNGVVINHTGCKHKFPWIIVEKTQSRRIVLEETGEIMTREKEGYVLTDGEHIDYIHSGISISPPHKIWKEVKE